MGNQIKLIWDFRGANAQKIAEHHVIHLDEFVALEKIENTITAIQQVSSMYSIAYLVVDESLMNILREKLKPHRGQKYSTN